MRMKMNFMVLKIRLFVFGKVSAIFLKEFERTLFQISFYAIQPVPNVTCHNQLKGVAQSLPTGFISY